MSEHDLTEPEAARRMHPWRDEIATALAAFHAVAESAGCRISPGEIVVEFCDAPHSAPKRLPTGRVAVYGFWCGGAWLKVGKVGPKSNARYTSQHYLPGSAISTLAGSLTKCPEMRSTTGFVAERPGDWIRRSTCRVNILIPERYNGAFLSLLEAYLHVRLKPRYEG